MRTWDSGIILIGLLLSMTSQGKAKKSEIEKSLAHGVTGRKVEDSVHSTLDPHTTRMTQQIERLLRTHSYEMSVRPSQTNNDPVLVGVSMLIESISDISEVNMDFTITLRICKSWTDDRLKLREGGEHDSIVLPSRLIDKLWVPDLYIVGSKKSFIHRTTVDNIMLRLYKNGTVWITTTVACQMNLYNFPLDIENCTFAVQSLAYTSDEVQLEWWMGESTEEMFMNPKLVGNMPKFKLVHHKLHNNIVKVKQAGGRVSQLKVSFELQRYLLSVFFQSYFPAIIMVILAGLGMWLDPTSVPARVAMGITSVLTISTIITGLKNSLPKVSYLTAMDLYLWTCFLFVFSTVLEYCVLNYIMTLQTRHCQKETRVETEVATMNGAQCNGSTPKYSAQFATNQRALLKRQSTRFTSQDEEGAFDTYLRTLSSQREHHKRSVTVPRQRNVRARRNVRLSSARRNMSPIKRGADATKIDVFFRIFYFLSFAIFNLVYWIYYVISTQHASDDD